MVIYVFMQMWLRAKDKSRVLDLTVTEMDLISPQAMFDVSEWDVDILADDLID